MGRAHESETARYRSTIKDTYNKALSKAIITPENLPFIAYPIVNFVHQEKPDYILAFDRGARMIGLTTFMLYKDVYGELPTRDKRINFRKVSRKIPQEDLRTQFKLDVEKMTEHTDSPKVLLLEDWVITGRTREIATDLISEFSGDKATVHFGVMRGKGRGIKRRKEADISGDRHSYAYYAWRNNTDLLGIDYDQSVNPKVVRSPQAIEYRRRLVQSVRKFSKRITESNQTEAISLKSTEIFPNSG